MASRPDMYSGRIPEHGVLGKQVGTVRPTVDTVADRAVSGDERAHFVLGLEVGQPGVDIEFGHYRIQSSLVHPRQARVPPSMR